MLKDGWLAESVGTYSQCPCRDILPCSAVLDNLSASSSGGDLQQKAPDVQTPTQHTFALYGHSSSADTALCADPSSPPSPALSSFAGAPPRQVLLPVKLFFPCRLIFLHSPNPGGEGGLKSFCPTVPLTQVPQLRSKVVNGLGFLFRRRLLPFWGFGSSYF